ncbi:MAG: hypothetical protein LBT50_08925 [Prevotellaceae bacterium]|nr:hypothetical protein [Prevotellaceae bacterium]
MLGPKEDRYFSNGFKGIDISYNDEEVYQGQYKATIAVGFGVWAKKKGTVLTPHLGTTEFISVAAVVCQQLMEKSVGLSPEIIKRAWINHFNCKMKPCDDTDYDNIPVSGKIVSEQKELDHVVYGFEVRIGSVLIKPVVCSPLKEIKEANSRQDQEVDHQETDNYKEGYKLRDLEIKDVHVDREMMVSGGKTILHEQIHSQKGLGAHYHGILLTDFILITGQLTQALLCHINCKTRTESSNLWLREIDAWCETPSEGKYFDSEVRFSNVQTLQTRGEKWLSVGLTGTVGNIHSRIKVAQRVN